MKRNRTIRAGALAALALALVFMIQWAAGALPIWDTTPGRLATPSQEAAAVAKGITIPTTLYLVAADGATEAYLQAYVQKLAALNKNLSYEHVLPTDGRLAAYSASALADNTIIVASAKRFALLSQSDLYEFDTAYDYYSGSYYYSDVRLAVEDRVTRALTYVTGDMPEAYLLTGHGEPETGLSLRAALQSAMIGLSTLSLAELDAVPSDAQILLIGAPTKDFSTHEIEMLQAYLDGGGNVLVTTDCAVGALPRLSALLEAYGMRMRQGLVLEGDSARYIQTYQQYILPALTQDHESVQAAALDGLAVTTPMAHGIEILNHLPSALTVTPLLTTGETAYLKPNVNQLTTLAREDADQSGPFHVAVAAERAAGKIIWVASGVFLGDNAFQASEGANARLLAEMLGWMTPLPGRASYPAKSIMSYLLTVDQAWQIALFALWIGLPAVLLAVAAVKGLRRRRV